MSQTHYFVHAHLFSLALCFLTINWGNYSSFLLWAGGSSFSPTAILLHYRGWTSHTQILPKLHQVAIIPIPTDPSMGRKQPVSCGSPSYSRRNRCCQLRLYPKFTSYPGYKRSRRAESGWEQQAGPGLGRPPLSAQVDKEPMARQSANSFAAGVVPTTWGICLRALNLVYHTPHTMTGLVQLIHRRFYGYMSVFTYAEKGQLGRVGCTVTSRSLRSVPMWQGGVQVNE